MKEVREFEMKAVELFTEGFMAGNLHTSVGQEAIAVGVCAALKPADLMVPTHRGHGQVLVRGSDPNLMMAELCGKSTGYCKGKGGSMHLANVELGILGTNGIIGASLPIGTGSALASKIKGTNEVTVIIFGDGASNEGTFHESLNMASAWKLPCVYICENNLYGVSTDIRRVTSVQDISTRAKGYDIPGVTVDGNDVYAVMHAVSTAIERARRGEGPSLVECKTYRHRGHYEGDPQIYKPKEEVEEWKKRDPIVRLRKEIIESGMASEAEILDIEKQVAAKMEAAAVFAKESPFPEAYEVTTDIYSSDNDRSVAR
ncbi:MAG: thiamine pyrophosphate-dependent dehydrogenase E1 component subunit alpha [Rhodospirillaceae bacterium]|nr:thiamine pyrophosphate-dependent dehydrogenase E1 component subunit alpha [Rhodospirillaceae bacterium]